MPNFIDIEASGLHFDAWPIEIAASCGPDIRSWLIRPEPNWLHWSASAEQLHGISRVMLTQQGVPAKEVARQLGDFLADSDGLIYSDAVAWDEDWVNTLFHASGEIRQFHLLPLEDLFDEVEFALFHANRQALRESGKYRVHRATQDVMLLCDAYRMTEARIQPPTSPAS